MPAPELELNVAIDATPLVGSRTGVGVAVTGMVGHLARRSDVRLVGYGITGRGRAALRAALPPGVRSALAPLPAAALLRIWAHSDAVPVEQWAGRVDVVHGTNFVVPPARRAVRVVTVHDLTAVRFPALCTANSLRFPGLVRRAVSQGAWVHTVSEWVAAEVVEYFGTEPDRVRVVPLGLEPPGSAPPAVGATGRPYVLGLGTTEPRKDFPGLVTAFDRLAAGHPDVELKLVGPPGWGESAVADAIARAAHRDRIHRVGWVDDPIPLLAGAAVFAYPSVYEGFGLPPLEAMALGTPVVASDTGSLPEILGGAARLVPPGDPDGLAAALAEVLDNPAERDRLVAAGRARAAIYTWAASAEGLVRLYRDALAEPTSR